MLLQEAAEAQIKVWQGKAAAAAARADETDKRASLQAIKAKEAASRDVDASTAALATAEKCRAEAEARVAELRGLLELERTAHAAALEAAQREAQAAAIGTSDVRVDSAQREWERQAGVADARSRREAAEALRLVQAAHEAEMLRAGREVTALQQTVRQLQRGRPDLSQSQNHDDESAAQQLPLQSRPAVPASAAGSPRPLTSAPTPSEPPRRGATNDTWQRGLSRTRVSAEGRQVLRGVAAEGMGLWDSQASLRYSRSVDRSVGSSSRRPPMQF